LAKAHNNSKVDEEWNKKSKTRFNCKIKVGLLQLSDTWTWAQVSWLNQSSEVRQSLRLELRPWKDIILSSVLSIRNLRVQKHVVWHNDSSKHANSLYDRVLGYNG
jgi:hypothetical protein